MFDDSTHRLWQCDTVDGMMILKVCDDNSVGKSCFWQGMNSLFDSDLTNQLGEFDKVYQTVNALSPLQIPDYIASGSQDKNTQSPAFMLSRMVEGESIKLAQIDNATVQTLAEHLSCLHGQQHAAAGGLNTASISPEQWIKRLDKTIQLLARDQAIPDSILAECMAMIKSCSPDSFVPIMLDLRWDQFLQKNGTLTALVDLDAFVYAPRSLELVLLEYLLNKDQAIVFKQYYKISLTELNMVRKPYRLLLFLMNVLGEQSCERWMNAEIRF